GVALTDVPGHALGEVDRSMLAPGAAERDGEIREAPILEITDMGVDQRKYVVPEHLDLGCALEELHDGRVAAGAAGVLRVASRVRKRAAIEHVPPSVAGLVRRRSLAIAE